MEKCGFGNWKNIADYISTKTMKQVEDHVYDVYFKLCGYCLPQTFLHNEQFDSVPTVEEASGSKRRPTGRTNSSSSYYGIAMSQENGNATISTNNGTSSASVLSLVEEHLRVFADLLQQQQNSSFT
jgi:hypothetical protein